MTFTWTLPDPLNNTAKTKSIYMTELQVAANVRRVEIAQSQLSFINQNIGKKFILSAIEELKTVTNQLAIDFGYPTGVEDSALLGRPYVTITKKYGKSVCHYPILNDLRMVLNNLVSFIILTPETWSTPQTFNKNYNKDYILVQGSGYYDTPVGEWNQYHDLYNPPYVNGDWNEWPLLVWHRLMLSDSPSFVPIPQSLKGICKGFIIKTNKMQFNNKSGIEQVYWSNVFSHRVVNSAQPFEVERAGKLPFKVAFEIRDLSAVFSHSLYYFNHLYPGVLYPEDLLYNQELRMSLGIYNYGGLPVSYYYQTHILKKYNYSSNGSSETIIDIDNIVDAKFNTGLIILPANDLYRIEIKFYIFCDITRCIGSVFGWPTNITLNLENNISFDDIVPIDMR
jgi:hypothetical protein